MTRRVPTDMGRLFLMGIVMSGLILSLASLFWMSREGGIISEIRNYAIVELLKIYLPLLSLIAAFYFGEKKNDKQIVKTTPLDAFIFVLVITSMWSMAPMLLLWLGGPIEEVLEVMKNIKPFGDVIVLAGIGFYFSKK